MSDPSQALYPCRGSSSFGLHYLVTIFRVGPFRHNHNGKPPPGITSRTDGSAHLRDIKGDLGQQDHICSTCYARLKGNPTSIAPHHFHYHYALMTFGGSVEPIQSFGYHPHCGVIAKSYIGGAQIVIY